MPEKTENRWPAARSGTPALDPEGAFNGASPAVQMAGLREYASKSWDGWTKTVNISERAGRMQNPVRTPCSGRDLVRAVALKRIARQHEKTCDFSSVVQVKLAVGGARWTWTVFSEMPYSRATSLLE